MRASIKDPSFLGALSFFDAAARTSSFQDAANELNVSPSAVSHRIAALEQALGHKLFRRGTRQVLLTREGSEFASTVRSVMREVHVASERLSTTQVLRVSVGPYISSNWLMSRIGQFEQSNPLSRIDLIHTTGTTPARDTDVAIVWDKMSNRHSYFASLFDIKTVPVASPALGCKKKFWEQNWVPIHYRDRNAWRLWLSKAKGDPEFAEQGEVLDDPNLVVEAAVHGRGIALGFLPFVSEPIENGRLKIINNRPVPAEWTYAIKLADETYDLANSFLQWVIDQAESTAGFNSCNRTQAH
ncbi:MAG: LysR family transcriptional regulator [Gammaproteobacteria bacterium]|nr:LysR family transcriptional regulator [Gammaproteobacteria bacterium]